MLKLVDCLQKTSANTTNEQICEVFNLCMGPVNPNDELRRQKRSLEVRLPLEMISQLRDKLKGDLTAGFYNHLRHMDHLTPAEPQQEAGESQTSDDTFTVVQLTDVHISPDYATVSKSDI